MNQEHIAQRVEQSLVARWWILWMLAAAGALAFQWPAMMNDESSALRDNTQLYLLGNAISLHLFPYLSIAHLREVILHIANTYQSHSSPYPPLIGLLMSLISWLSLAQFQAFFLTCNLVCLWGALSELSKIAFKRELTLKARIAIYSLLLFTIPIQLGIYFGQIDPILLFLFSRSLRIFLENKNSIISGILFSLAVQLKTLGWITALWISLRDKRFFIGCLLSACIGVGAILFWLGSDVLSFYLNHAAKEVALTYGNNISNQSILSFVTKIKFPVYVKEVPGKYLPVVQTSLEADAFIEQWLLLIPILFGFLFLITCKKKSFAVGTSLSLILSLLVSPISWGFYHLNLLLVLALLLRASISLPRWVYGGIAILFVIDIPSTVLSVVYALSARTDQIIELSKGSVILASLPMFFLISVFFILALKSKTEQG